MGIADRVLFVAEAVTLAHVARPIVLANSLQGSRYSAVMACSPRFQPFFGGNYADAVPLDSISSQQFLRALANGSPVYDLETLRRYLEEDLRIIKAVEPSLVVGDFRLSLAVSCRLAGVPYATITNAYWSPFWANRGFPLPVLPMTRVLPIGICNAIFRAARPIAVAMHCKAMNTLRTENGLAPLGNDLSRVYTDADHTLYADAREMFDFESLPVNHHFLGPILWSPPFATPPWWTSIPEGRPIIYVTLGSSGYAAVFNRVIDALIDMPVTVIASTAGAPITHRPSSNVFTAEYLPGIEAAARSQLVICNGGNLTCYQALVAGVPVLGIATNMDQFLNMTAVVGHGAGLVLRADRLDADDVRSAVTRLLGDAAITGVAKRLLSHYTRDTAAQRFVDWIDGAL